MTTKIKPIVIGYKQIGFDGQTYLAPIVRDASETAVIAARDFELTGIKSKFKPVYDGNEVIDD